MHNNIFKRRFVKNNKKRNIRNLEKIRRIRKGINGKKRKREIQYTFTFGFCGAKNESYMKVFVKRGRGGVPPAFLYAVALAHPVVYFHFRILQGKETC